MTLVRFVPEEGSVTTIPFSGITSRIRKQAHLNAIPWRREIRQLLRLKGRESDPVATDRLVRQAASETLFGIPLDQNELLAVLGGAVAVRTFPLELVKWLPTTVGFADLGIRHEEPYLKLKPARVKYRSVFVPDLLAQDADYLQTHLVTWETLGVWLARQALLGEPPTLDLAVVGEIVEEDVDHLCLTRDTARRFSLV